MTAEAETVPMAGDVTARPIDHLIEFSTLPEQPGPLPSGNFGPAAADIGRIIVIRPIERGFNAEAKAAQMLYPLS